MNLNLFLKKSLEFIEIQLLHTREMSKAVSALLKMCIELLAEKEEDAKERNLLAVHRLHLARLLIEQD